MKIVSLVAPKLLILLALALGAASGASAQATRTWVSGVGDDANPCSRTAPCKTFAGAISKTQACGEINAIDPAGYGAVTITKPITIDGLGTNASIFASLVNGIIINVPVAAHIGCAAGAPAVVTLRNLTINGSGDGINGIRVIAVDELHVQHVQIFGFRNVGASSGNGIDFNPTRAAALFLSDSSITDNLNQGVWLRPVGVVASAILKNVRLNQNGSGMLVGDNAFATVTDSVSSANVAHGFQVSSAALASSGKLHLDRTVINGNGSSGVRTDGPGAVIRLSGTTIVQNGSGISNGGGTIATFLNNTIAGNLPGGDGATTLTFPLK